MSDSQKSQKPLKPLRPLQPGAIRPPIVPSEDTLADAERRKRGQGYTEKFRARKKAKTEKMTQTQTQIEAELPVLEKTFEAQAAEIHKMEAEKRVKASPQVLLTLPALKTNTEAPVVPSTQPNPSKQRTGSQASELPSIPNEQVQVHPPTKADMKNAASARYRAKKAAMEKAALSRFKELQQRKEQINRYIVDQETRIQELKGMQKRTSKSPSPPGGESPASRAKSAGPPSVRTSPGRTASPEVVHSYVADAFPHMFQ